MLETQLLDGLTEGEWTRGEEVSHIGNLIQISLGYEDKVDFNYLDTQQFARLIFACLFNFSQTVSVVLPTYSLS